MSEEEVNTVGKKWREVKATAGNTVHYYCFLEALCSKVQQEINLTCNMYQPSALAAGILKTIF
jgi:hypothetical protein